MKPCVLGSIALHVIKEDMSAQKLPKVNQLVMGPKPESVSDYETNLFPSTLYYFRKRALGIMGQRFTKELSADEQIGI